MSQQQKKTEKEPCSHVYDELAEPQEADVPREHPLWPAMLAALRGNLRPGNSSQCL